MDYDFIPQRHFDLIQEGEAKFIFEQAEKHLKDQIDTSQQIGTKTTTLLTVITGLMIGLIGFGVTRWSAVQFDDIVASAFIGSIYLYCIVHVLLKNIKPHLYNSVGLHARDLFVDKVFNDANKDYRLIAIYVNEIKECQKKIDQNAETNNARWARFNRALKLVIFTPAFFFGIYLLSRAVVPCFLKALHYHL